MESFTDINLKMTRDNADKKKGKKGEMCRVIYKIEQMTDTDKGIGMLCRSAFSGPLEEAATSLICKSNSVLSSAPAF